MDPNYLRQPRVGFDLGIMKMSTVDGMMNSCEEGQLLTALRYSTGGTQAPDQILAHIESLRKAADALDEEEFAVVMHQWGQANSMHGTDLMHVLSKIAVCDAPICSEERRFMAAVAFWVSIDREQMLQWRREIQATFDDSVKGGADMNQLVSTDALVGLGS